jgi:hypothetical protein
VKKDWVAAERVEEVRAAADGWRRAGAVDAGTFKEISGRYPEPRILPSPLWRALTAFFVTAILLLLTGALFMAFRPEIGSAFLLLFFLAVACLVATEAQENAPRLALRGGAGATCFWGILFLLGGLFLLLEETLKVREAGGLTIVVLSSFVLWALAAWRWGSPVCAGFAGISLFLLLARAPLSRLLWIAGGVALTLVFGRFLDRPSWSPSHRRGAAVLVAIGFLGAYAAVNLYSLDHRLVEELGSAGLDAPGPRFSERIESMVLTALFPVAVVAWGIRSRRAFALDTGLALTALSLLTLRFYVHLAATWLLLTLAGAALLLLALFVNRWLAKGGNERNGFTADPLFADERRFRALELVPVVAAHAPESRTPAEPGYEGGGGSFGGGGAGGSY